jgi:hypothetical protein
VPTGRHIYSGANLDGKTCTALNVGILNIYIVEAPLGAAGTWLAIVRINQTGKAVKPMKLESIIVALLLAGGSNLFARVLTEGVEPALVGTVIDWSATRIRTAIKQVRSYL